MLICCALILSNLIVHLYTCTCTFTTLTIVCTDLVMIEQATCDCILIGTLTCNKS